MNRLQLREAFVKQSGRYNLVGSKTVLGERMPDYTVDDGADRYVDEAIRMLESEVLTTRNLRHYIRTATADFPGVAIPNIIHVKQVAIEDVALKMALESDLMKRLSLETDTGDPTHWLEAHDTIFTEPLPIPAGAIEISSISEMQLIGSDDSYPLDGTYVLTQDIDASVTAAWNGGKGFEPIEGFSGVFDGHGYTISDLTINRPTEAGGLFYGITGTVQNLNLEGTITLLYGGSIASSVNGIITNCSFSGTLTTLSPVLYCGGICGHTGTTASVSHLTCLATITCAGSGVGGVIGVADGTLDINCCKFVGSVTGSNYVGGIVGHISGQGTSSTIRLRDCIVQATVTATGVIVNYVGGIAGRLEYGRLLNCLAVCTITAADAEDSYIGGVVGELYRGIGLPQVDESLVLDSYYDSDVSGLEDTDRGTPKTTKELYLQSTYTNWDFQSIWDLSTSYSYPDLIDVDSSRDTTTILLYPYPEGDTVVHVSCWVHDPLTSDTDSNWWSIHYPYAIVDLAYAILSASELNNDRRIIDQSVERVKMEIYKQDIRDEVAHLGSQII